MADTPRQKYEWIQKTLWQGETDSDGNQTEPPKAGHSVSERDADRIQYLCDAFDEEKLDRSEHTEKKAHFDRNRRGERSYTTL